MASTVNSDRSASIHVGPDNDHFDEIKIETRSRSLLIWSIVASFMFPPTGLFGVILAALTKYHAHHGNNIEAYSFYKITNILLVVTVALGVLSFLGIAFYFIIIFSYIHSSPYLKDTATYEV